MGQYIQCGIATNICIQKKYESSNMQEMMKRIGEVIDLNLYNQVEENNEMYLTMKDEIFEKHAVEFVLEQVDLFMEPYQKDAKRELEKLKGKTCEELQKFVENDTCYHFMDGDFWQEIYYLDEKQEFRIYAKIVIYLLAGKAFVEEENCLFGYLRNAIIGSSKNPIRTAAMVVCG